MRGTKSSEKRVFPREIVHLSGTGTILSKGPGGEGKRMHEAKGGGARFPVSTADVSASGLQLHFNADLVTRDMLRLMFPGNEPGQQLEIEGQLVWVRKNAVDIFGRYTAGMHFRKPDDSLPARLVAAEQAPK